MPRGAFTPFPNRYVAEQYLHEAHVDGPCSTLAYARHPSFDTAWNVIEYVPFRSRCIVTGHIDADGRFHNDSCLI